MVLAIFVMVFSHFCNLFGVFQKLRKCNLVDRETRWVGGGPIVMMISEIVITNLFVDCSLF